MKQLIDKFLAGATSGEEERKLFEAFAPGKSVPPELEAFRPMMQWYASLSSLSGNTQHETEDKRSTWRRHASLWLSTAASVAVIFILGAIVLTRPSGVKDLYAEYNGSYIVHNGIKTTNLSDILPEVQQAELLVEQRQREIELRIQSRLDDKPSIEKLTHSDNPEINRRIKAMFEE